LLKPGHFAQKIIIMKRILIVLFVLSMSVNRGNANDIFMTGSSDRFMIDLFTDIWSNVPSGMELSTINRGVNISMMQSFTLGASPFSVATGLGFAGHNLYSDHYFRHQPHYESSLSTPPASFRFVAINENDGEIKKNKLSLNYINLPLELRYHNYSLPQPFRVSAGVRAGYLVNAHTKVHLKNEDGVFGAGSQKESKTKEHKLGNLEKFQFGFTARVGYGRINLNTYFPLTKIFKANNAVDMTPISVGLTFIVY
jgi:hypothetical protein